MTARILQFPSPAGEPFTLGDCTSFADQVREEWLLPTARDFLQYAEKYLAEGQAGAAVGAMAICAALLTREIFDVRRTPKDVQHVLFTLPKGATSASEMPVPRRRRTLRRHPMLALPFVADRPRGDKRGRCFWHVVPTGDYMVDFRTGEKLAQQYLGFRDGMLPLLNWIVGDMPRPLTGIEVGFLYLISRAAELGK
jgi:hypothetical protein